MKGWYFATEERCLQYGDGRKIVVGKSHSIQGMPEVCCKGLHASPTILQALRYAPGPVLYEVEVTRHLDKEESKFCGQRRKYLRGGHDITPVLNKFARECALYVAHLWGMPEVVREYLTTGNEDLRSAARAAAWTAAEAAARSAAEAAAEAAARSAAEAAAWSAARSAAEAAARSAAWSAARAAAWSATRSAVESTQNTLLKNLIFEFWQEMEKRNEI